ncbi:outer membrane beta-barrel protein [Archangium primigenium]|uniref:outer membrane beta-barrel protein n=1 Tax=[Archangium] primigenium TaxID=2792470 RepID=UPI00195AE7F3|nr:outer membrane beta-barrel protein [Archangium primigenium]MBM7114702.1 porin [Archangium primigenium]
MSPSPSSLLALLPSVVLGQSGPESLVSRVRVEGGVDVYYAANANRPRDGAHFTPGAGTTAVRDRAFSLNLASLGMSLDPAPVGFRVFLGIGTAMEVVHAAEPVGTALGPEVWRLLQQASLFYMRGPLSLEAGVYPSHIGLESFQSQRNWSYTRSWMGELSPYYQTGLKGTWTFSDTWSAQLHLLNGWQTIGENNRGKAVGTQVAYAGERLSASFNTFVGEEGTGDDAGWRLFADGVATWRVTEAFSLAATADVATQRRRARPTAFWSAAGLNARVQLARAVAVAARAELFDDRDGVISGTAQRLVEGTATLELTPAEPLVLKLEARHDRSTANVFGSFRTSAEGTPLPVPTQTLVVAGATASF